MTRGLPRLGLLVGPGKALAWLSLWVAGGALAPRAVGIQGPLSARGLGLAGMCLGWEAAGPSFILFALVFTGLSSWHRMDDSYCLSALRSPFYPIPTPGSLPPLHPSAMHLHLSGVRYPPELSHSSLAALHSERMSSLSAER